VCRGGARPFLIQERRKQAGGSSAPLNLPPPPQHASTTQTLAVTNGTLTAIPQEMAALAALRDLDLHKNELQVFPHQLCALTGLTVCMHTHHHWRRAPRAFTFMFCNARQPPATRGMQSTLLTAHIMLSTAPPLDHTPQSLNLMGNRLSQLPQDFGRLVGLQKLGLKSNQLQQLPSSFTQLTNLVELFITDNALTELPRGFGAGLASLVKLQASFNPWRALPPDLLQLPRLEMFRLAAGHLPAWPSAPSSPPPANGGAGGAGAAGSGPPLPALAWCSLGGNPAAAHVPPIRGIPLVDVSEVEIDRGHPLGDGASGECFPGGWVFAFVWGWVAADPWGLVDSRVGVERETRRASLQMQRTGTLSTTPPSTP